MLHCAVEPGKVEDLVANPSAAVLVAAHGRVRHVMMLLSADRHADMRSFLADDLLEYMQAVLCCAVVV